MPSAVSARFASLLLTGLKPRDDLSPFGFADYADAQLFGLLELRTGPRPRDDKVGLGADRAGRAGAEALGLRLGFVAAHRFQAAGEDDRLARPLGLLRVADERLRGHLGEKVVEGGLIVLLVEEVVHRLGD